MPFGSSIAVFAVCEHCRSMVVLHDSGVERLGEMAALPPDLSPLQIGSCGVWKGVTFELVGRIRVEWDGGSWTEWFAEFDDRRTGWVAETQGFFAISFPQKYDGVLPAIGEVRAGMSLRLADHGYEVVDVKSVVCLAGEGALSFAAPPGLTRQSVDLMAQDGSFATIDYPLGDPPELFTGAYATAESLRFSNLRPVPGWDGAVAQTRHATNALGCPICGAAVSLRASGLTMAAVCGSCGSVIDTANPNLRVIQEADEKVRAIRPLIPIGTRGKIYDDEYEVIGLLVRKDPFVQWSEYLLFNPWKGFRWLVTFNGHWSFIDRLLEIPKPGGPKVTLRDGRVFKHFASASTHIVAVLGEFFWKVTRGEHSVLADYIEPPFIVSSEKYLDLEECTWSTGVYIDAKKIANSFAIQYPPKPSGIYLNQPNQNAEHWRNLHRPVLVLLALAFVLHFFFRAISPERTVTSGEFAYQRPAEGAAVETDPARTVVLPEFQFTGRPQPVRVVLSAPVKNNWLGIDVALVNADTERTIEGDVTVEYYEGIDEGEAWSEGGSTQDVRFPAVPAGRYYLAIDAEADPSISTMIYDVEIRRGGVFTINFVLVLLLILAYPAWVLFRRICFEASRWAQSDHASSD